MHPARPVVIGSTCLALSLGSITSSAIEPAVARAGRAGTGALAAALDLRGDGVDRMAWSAEYVSLGDSVAAGVGTDERRGQACHRSSRSFPALIADRYGWSLQDRGCDGAETSDVLRRQSAALTERTDAVSLTVGSEDVGLPAALTACALPSWLADCSGAVRAAVTAARKVLPTRLTAVYGAVRRKAPNATIIVAGYPRPLGHEDCDLATFLAPAETARLNQAVDVLDAVIADRADRAGIAFIDVRAAFDGHHACTAQPWVNRPSWPSRESYQPNRAGHQAYAALVGPSLAPQLVERLVLPLPGRDDRGDVGEASLTAASARRLPHLAALLIAPKNLARARRLGIAPATILRLSSALRGEPGANAAAALRELRALDRRVQARLDG